MPLVHQSVFSSLYCQRWNLLENIPILPEAFLTFASKSSVGPSYVANGQEDHKTYTNLNDDTITNQVLTFLGLNEKRKKNMVKP